MVNKGGPRLSRIAARRVAGGSRRRRRAARPGAAGGGPEDAVPQEQAAADVCPARIANDRIGVRTIEISGIDDRGQLANAVRFRAQEALPIPLDEAVLDYRILADSVDEQGSETAACCSSSHTASSSSVT